MASLTSRLRETFKRASAYFGFDKIREDIERRRNQEKEFDRIPGIEAYADVYRQVPGFSAGIPSRPSRPQRMPRPQAQPVPPRFQDVRYTRMREQRPVDNFERYVLTPIDNREQFVQSSQQEQKRPSLVSRIKDRLQELSASRDMEDVKVLQAPREVARRYHEAHPAVTPEQVQNPWKTWNTKVPRKDQQRFMDEISIPESEGGLIRTFTSADKSIPSRQSPTDCTNMSAKKVFDATFWGKQAKLQAMSPEARENMPNFEIPTAKERESLMHPLRGVASQSEAMMVELTDGFIYMGADSREGAQANVEAFTKQLDTWFEASGADEPSNLMDVSRAEIYMALRSGIQGPDGKYGPNYRESMDAVQNIDPIIRQAVLDEIHGFTAPEFESERGQFLNMSVTDRTYSGSQFRENPPLLTREVYEANYQTLRANPDQVREANHSRASFEELGIAKTDIAVSGMSQFAEHGFVGKDDFDQFRSLDRSVSDDRGQVFGSNVNTPEKDFMAMGVATAEGFNSRIASVKDRFQRFEDFARPTPPGVHRAPWSREAEQCSQRAMEQSMRVFASNGERYPEKLDVITVPRVISTPTRRPSRAAAYNRTAAYEAHRRVTGIETPGMSSDPESVHTRDHEPVGQYKSVYTPEEDAEAQRFILETQSATTSTPSVQTTEPAVQTATLRSSGPSV